MSDVWGTVYQMERDKALGCDPESLRAENARLKDQMRRMSNALLKVRPLGGSEMVSKIEGDYYADADYCGALIEQLRNDLHQARKDLALAEKRRG